MKKLIFSLMVMIAASVMTSCEDVDGKQTPINMNKLKRIIGISSCKSVVNTMYLRVIYVTC